MHKITDNRQVELSVFLIRQLRVFIAQQLPKAPRLLEAATSVNMSERTLQRLLQFNNTSFRLLINECRHELAKQYLLQADYSLQQIAFQLGFEEQSSFQKAFKTWQGCSPGVYRHRQLQASRLNQYSVPRHGVQVNYGIN